MPFIHRIFNFPKNSQATAPRFFTSSLSNVAITSTCPPQILDSREADEKANIPEPFANRSRADQRDLDVIIATTVKDVELTSV